jgi:hypothetical protein
MQSAKARCFLVARGGMSFIGRGSYFAAAVAGVASAFYIFEPEFKELKRAREGQAVAASPVAPAPEISHAAVASSSGRWQELTSRDGKVYWMNLDTGASAAAFPADYYSRNML